MSTIKTWQERLKDHPVVEDYAEAYQAEITELREAIKVAQEKINSMQQNMENIYVENKALASKLSAIEAQEPFGLVCGVREKGEFFGQLLQPMPEHKFHVFAAPVAPAQPEGDAERQERDVAYAHALFSNLKLHGEHSALKAALSSLWPSAFSHGFQVAKEIYSAKAAQSVNELIDAAERVSWKYGHDNNGIPSDWDEWKNLRTALANAKAAKPLAKEQVARKFHDTYERLAPSFGYETRKETRTFDPTAPNGKLMIAVCGEIMKVVRG